MLSDQQNLIIDKLILDQTLTGDEQKMMEALRLDQKFIDELNYRKDTSAALKSLGRSTVKSDLAAIDSRRNSRKRLHLLSIAASAIIVVAIAIWLIFPKQPSTDQLFAQYFSPYENVVDPIMKGTEIQRSGFQDYELGNYTEAKTKLEELKNGDAYFYLAMISMLDEDFKGARDYLDLTKTQNDPNYKNKISWYQGLIHLKSGERQNAIDLLEQLAIDGPPNYQAKSLALLEKLK